MQVNIGTTAMMDPNFDPLSVLDELAHEVVRLKKRQLELERFFQELANQHSNIAQHVGGQSQEITEIYNELGRILSETKQSTDADS